MLDDADALDFAADAEALAPTGAKLGNISALILNQLAAEGEIVELEERLKRAKENLRRIQEGQLPEALAEARVGDFTTEDGVKVAVKEDLTMSIPKKNVGKTNDWLRKHELGDLIAPTVTVVLTKGQDNVAARLIGYLEEHGFSFTREDKANTTSVKAALKRKIEAGEEVPLDLFGGFIYKKAVITLPKA